MSFLRQHNVTLEADRLRLRPATEDDWLLLMRWYNDPEVLYLADCVLSWTLADLQEMYRAVSQKAFIFIAELDGSPIGDGWLQEMNMARVLERYPRQDLRRIDLAIGEKRFWGHGWGTRMISLLSHFGFDTCRADALFAIGVGDHNPRSRRAFEKNGFAVDAVYAHSDAGKGKVEWDLRLTRKAVPLPEPIPSP